MKTVAAHAVLLIPFEREWVEIGIFRHSLVECRVENGNLWNVGQNGLSRLNTGNVRRIVKWRQMLHLLDRIEDVFINHHGAGEFFPSVDNPMADCRNLINVF